MACGSPTIGGREVSAKHLQDDNPAGICWMTISEKARGKDAWATRERNRSMFGWSTAEQVGLSEHCFGSSLVGTMMCVVWDVGGSRSQSILRTLQNIYV